MVDYACVEILINFPLVHFIRLPPPPFIFRNERVLITIVQQLVLIIFIVCQNVSNEVLLIGLRFQIFQMHLHVLPKL